MLDTIHKKVKIAFPVDPIALLEIFWMKVSLGDGSGSEVEILTVDGVGVVVPLVVVEVLRVMVLTMVGDEFEPKAGVSGVGSL